VANEFNFLDFSSIMNKNKRKFVSLNISKMFFLIRSRFLLIYKFLASISKKHFKEQKHVDVILAILAVFH
jgi:hypothetical protein